MHHFILSFEIMYLIPCIKTCYGPGIVGKKDVSANTHQNSRAIRDGSRCQITNAFTDVSNQITMFLVWPLDGGSAPFTLLSFPLKLRICHHLLSLGPSTWLLHVAPPLTGMAAGTGAGTLDVRPQSEALTLQPPAMRRTRPGSRRPQKEKCIPQS